AQARADGARSRNEPFELPRIAQTLAQLRGWTLEETAAITAHNAMQALPKLRDLVLPA
ncbi:MAG: TatD family hydrolase, partial [Burkholderiales bacterium]|nr:TatD family hydrolase [Burkholderiales bacterium]